MKLHRNVKILSLFEFLVSFSLAGVIFVIYCAKITGSYALAMSLYSVVFVSSSLFEIPTGIFSDLIGRKKTVILGSLAYLIAVIFYAWGFSYWILFIGAIFEGLARSFFSGNNNALLYDSLAVDKKTEEFDDCLGKIGSAGQIALAISSVMGGLIAAISLKTAMWLNIIPYTFLVIIAFQLIDIKKIGKSSGNIFNHLKEALGLFKENYKLRLLSLSSMTSFAFAEPAFLFRPVFISTIWPIWAIGLSNTLSFVGGSIGFYFSGKIMRKIKALKMLIITNLASRFINFFALIIANVVSPALMSITSLWYGPSSVAISTLMQKEFTDKQRATMGSINSLFGSLMFGIMSIILGLLADYLTPRKGLLILQFLQFIPFIIYLKIFQHDKKLA